MQNPADICQLLTTWKNEQYDILVMIDYNIVYNWQINSSYSKNAQLYDIFGSKFDLHHPHTYLRDKWHFALMLVTKRLISVIDQCRMLDIPNNTVKIDQDPWIDNNIN